MRKIGLLLMLALVLCGCGKEHCYETVTDCQIAPTQAQALEIFVSLREDASLATISTPEQGSLYLASDYSVTVQTKPGGDMKTTLQETTGFPPESLCVMQTQQGQYRCYECVWTAAGETGAQIGRCKILDDGNYHYILSAMADAQCGAALYAGDWGEMFQSFCLVCPEQALSSGS